jgi:hypothetical protein
MAHHEPGAGFPAASVRFEPCAAFGPDADDPMLCSACGWTEPDHHDVAPVVAVADRRRPRFAMPERRAS